MKTNFNKIYYKTILEMGLLTAVWKLIFHHRNELAEAILILHVVLIPFVVYALAMNFCPKASSLHTREIATRVDRYEQINNIST